MDQFNLIKSEQPKPGIKETIDQIFATAKRKKWQIFITVFISTLVVTIYSYVADPVYESSIILKKENVSDRNDFRDEFRNRFAVQSSDQLDTELELVQTRSVLLKVIKEVNLRLFLKELVYTDGSVIELGFPFKQYDYYLDDHPLQSNLPLIDSLQILNPGLEGAFYIEKVQPDKYVLNHSENGAIGSSDRSFQLNFMNFILSWPNSAVGDKLYFTIYDIEETLKEALDRIKLTREGKTSIFTFAVRARSPQLAQFMANAIAEKYREARIEQKRQTIHYSFEFIDEQIETIAANLKKTELQLSNYKSEHKIAILDESSRDLIRNISDLESEKVSTELELADYQNKLMQLKKEVENGGYFDQTYLTPRQTAETRTPFAVLLEQLSDLELQRLQLLQRRKETHPEVITITEQIDKTNKKLAEYNQNTLTAYQIIINTLRKKRNNLRAMLAKYSEKLENLPSVEARLGELVRDRNVHEKMYNLLMDKREELRVAEFSEIQDIVIIDAATLPIKPVSPRKRLNMALGFLLGLIAAIGFTVIEEYFNKKVTKIEDIKKYNIAPILAIIPKFSTIIDKKVKDIKSEGITQDHFVLLHDDPGPIREAFRVLRTKLIKMGEDDNNVFMITSSEEDSGKTSITSNLAISLAQTKKKVLLIDGDLRKSNISQLFKISDSFPGFHEFLISDDKSPQVWKPTEKFDDDIKKYLRIIPAGKITDEAAELLDSPKVEQLIDYARFRYDYVLIDTPPLTKVSDTLILGTYCQKSLFIVRPFMTFKDSLPFAFEQAKQFDIDIVGLVVNAFDLGYATGYYKYGYGYGAKKAKNVI